MVCVIVTGAKGEEYAFVSAIGYEYTKSNNPLFSNDDLVYCSY